MDLWRMVQPHTIRFAGGSESESDAHVREKLRRAFFMWWEDIMAEQDVFIVPEQLALDDAAEPAQPPPQEPWLITPQEKQALFASGTPVEEHLLAASMLAHFARFPAVVTCRILDFVGFVVTFETETDEHRGGRDNMDDLYLELALPSLEALQLPRGVTLGRCLDLTAECCSHDQGWATFDREHNGTYRASCTWSEVVATTRNEQDERVEVARAPICSNLRARNYYRHHCKHFEAPAGFAQHVQPGRHVELVLRSQFPGWTNTAKFGRLRAQLVLQFNDEFEFYPWAEIKDVYHRRQQQSHESWCVVQ